MERALEFILFFLLSVSVATVLASMFYVSPVLRASSVGSVAAVVNVSLWPYTVSLVDASPYLIVCNATGVYVLDPATKVSARASGVAANTTVVFARGYVALYPDHVACRAVSVARG